MKYRLFLLAGWQPATPLPNPCQYDHPRHHPQHHRARRALFRANQQQFGCAV